MKKILYLALALVFAVSCVGNGNSDKENDSLKSEDSTQNELLAEYHEVVNRYNYEVARKVKHNINVKANMDSLRKKCRDLEFKIHKSLKEMTPEERKQYRKIQSTFFRSDDLMKKDKEKK